MTPENLKTILDAHATWLADHTQGVRADLQGADLRDANLQGANLRGAGLQGAVLCDADLQGANLQGANLTGANLEEANLEEANLYGANLEEANLEEANLYGADLTEANLTGANLQGAVGPSGFCASYEPHSLLQLCADAGACAAGLACLWGLRADISLDEAIAVAAPDWADWLRSSRRRLVAP